MARWTAPTPDPRVTDRHVDVLLVGGGVAAARCARELRRGGFSGSIALVGDEGRLPYNRPPLSKELLRDDLPDDLLSAEPGTWYERRGIELRLGAGIGRIDLDARRAELDDGSTMGFERTLLATGAEVRRLPVPGGELALTLRTADDARRLRAAAMAAPGGAPVVVVGGGFIGLEVASGLAALGLRPIVLEMAPAAWGGALGTELATWAAGRLADAGVDLRLDTTVTRIEDGAVGIDGDRLEAAFVVAGIGVAPRVDLGARAGLRVDDGIVVDRGQRTSHAAAWAAGDVARVDGRPRIEHWHAAREAGERAARSMIGAPVEDPPVPWVFSEIGGTALDVFGVADAPEEERWVRRESVLALLDDDVLVGLAVIGSSLEPAVARRLVAEGASVRAVERAVSGEM
jgi:3-phenylpropionate/trans-cinnamate dioxygenase ferredoxin reductase component